MIRRSVSGRSEDELPGPGPRQRDQLPHRIRGQRRMQDDRAGERGDFRDGREIPGEVVPQLRIKARGDRVGNASQQQRVAVRRGFRDLLRADVAARAGAILDDHRLARPLAELLPDEARQHVGRPAGSERHHDPDRPARVILGRACERGEKRNEQRRISRDGAHGAQLTVACSGNISNRRFGNHKPKRRQRARPAVGAV